ncbi:HRDC domain-containing protein [Homoserinibacter sp. GY 40078]|uniref:HRDC domain-containing protein n=1 Tax=Homoserinibacter sp. GY 40078 TaxID=2603275 RepID=UPI00210339FE|nr:HRDC domain-containing protein [Homoserinibacter sp. GY 40078]
MTDEPVITADAEHPEVEVIDTREGYLLAVDALARGTGPFAVDAERASGFRYSQRAYLIQVFRRESGAFLFDPPAIGDFSELDAVMHGEEWVLHAASQDLACLREVGLDPETIFDTELGARLAGLPRVGLATVAEELLGVHLAKAHSAADWSTRPLPQEWLVYAALDVELLPDLRDKIAALLEDGGKSEFAQQEFAAVLEKTVPVRQEPWRRLSGMHALRSPRQLAIARALWNARDAFAQDQDVAPGRLVPDASLVAVAKAQPQSKRELAGLKEFTGRASRRELDRWWAAVEAGTADPTPPSMRGTGDGVPAPRMWADRNPEADRRLRLARTAVMARAEELSIPMENVLTPEVLRRVAWTPPSRLDETTIAEALRSHGARQWQVDELSGLIATAFVEALQPPADPAPDPS